MNTISFYDQLIKHMARNHPAFAREFDARFKQPGIWSRAKDDKDAVYMFIRTQLPSSAHEARRYLSPETSDSACIRELMRYVIPTLLDCFDNSNWPDMVTA